MWFKGDNERCLNLTLKLRYFSESFFAWEGVVAIAYIRHNSL